MPEESPPPGVLEYLGSKRLSMSILKAGAVYFTILTILWFSNLKPPAGYMFWGPFSVWAAIFLINLTISVSTKKYAYKGNLLFHIAFIVVLAGALLSALFRFSGDAIVQEGDTFWGDEKEYLRPPHFGSFERSYPSVSFKFDKITPGFWKEVLYFVQLEGTVRYPATTLSNTGFVRLNGGLNINGARLRLKNYGFFPEVQIEQEGRLVMKGAVRMMVFPPGTEDTLELKNYKLHVKVFPDPKFEAGAARNVSMNIREPVFVVRVEWLGNTIFKGMLKRDESVRIGELSISFVGLKPWVEVGIVKDIGEPVIFVGFMIGVAGLVLRLYPLIMRRAHKAEPESEG